MRRALMIVVLFALIAFANVLMASAAVNRYCIEVSAKVHNPYNHPESVTLDMGGTINGVDFYTMSKTFSIPAMQTKTFSIHHFYPRDYMLASVTVHNDVNVVTFNEQVVGDSVCTGG